ncbi:hypothetical protein HF896_06345 [Alicycliphilus denitrificans]|uniref:Uncharacterized protein n=1 Tax=Alicycliphilus denitrificans TaxID=179636 RepID=A0A858ZRW9_9BURK|nr:hypothetical protein [Alicycliphilus denitrificans]ADU98894.1 hypothetical protein Alide_1131 [Alicycliphilus denitrificans BC]QKD43252.1 hypothetical protein HF896_06345 [Alicycliphilus denitrificans]
MALTMTRTRTQTTLTKLAQKLGEVKGELVFVDEWMAEKGAPVELAHRRVLLVEQAEALVLTLQLFDPELDVDAVAQGEGWRKAYRVRSAKSLRTQYLRLHQASVSSARPPR